MRHDFLELEEEERIESERRYMPQSSEEDGLRPFGSLADRVVQVARAARSIAPQTESPIEATLGARLKLLIDQWPNLSLVPQYSLHRFRYDFAIVEGTKLIAAIECDGKDYHSTEAAQANDKAKNLAVWALGAEIFRFTGSQIFRRDVACVADVEAFLVGKFRRVGDVIPNGR